MKNRSGKRRIITILFFPLLALMFMVGFVASIYGEKNQRIKKKPKQTKNQLYEFEMKLIPQNEQSLINAELEKK